MFIEPRTLKGFADFGRKESVIRDRIFSKIKTVFTRYGFLPLETPTLEYKDILMNKYGEDEKLVYSFTDHGGREVALRYDLTVPMARYVAQNINTITLPYKRSQIQPVWRADNTQRGRSREFYQCDVDIVGSDTELGEIETLSCTLTALSEIGLPGSVVRISDRRLFEGFASRLSKGSEQIISLMRLVDKVYKKTNDELAADAVESYGFTSEDTELLRRVLTFIREGKTVDELSDLVTITPEVLSNVKKILQGMEAAGFGERVIFDLGITRGLEYYSATVWEFFTEPKGTLAIGSGGRYDGLIASFSDKEIPAVGSSLGITRIIEIAIEQGEFESLVKCIVLNIDPSLEAEYLRLAAILRSSGLNVDVYLKPEKLEKQFKYAEKLEIPFALIVGEVEKQKNTVQVKNLNNRTQTEVPFSEIAEFLKHA
ncbi:MAG TPA: histidine--tRNA ligase [Patescibacteria group bacterium]|nr:histidine--tRNA ligase [Patescibacteria group bacterium]